MPATKSHLDQFDVDIAQLGDPLTDDALDALSTIIEARDAARELLARLQQMQDQIEAGRAPYATREQHAIDLEELSDKIHVNIAGILG